MLFNSFEFLLFFPIVCIVYFTIPRNNWRNYFLLAASYYFYMGAHGLDNHIPLGTPGNIISSGLILFINIFVGTEVACTMYAFYALFRKGGL